MNLKGYLSTLIIILSLFGINWEPATVPNQEIVVQFDDGEISFDKAQSALTAVKQRLELIGVKNIRVVEASDGRLKITYFSDVDVADVKRILAEGHELFVASISFDKEEIPIENPSKDDVFGYELNVCEIENFSDIHFDLNGYILEPVPDTNNSVVPAQFTVAGENRFEPRSHIDRVAFSVYEERALQINNASYIIPEVRAGPGRKGISWF